VQLRNFQQGNNMTEFDNTDRGVLYRNENKTSENHPDYSGSVNVAGADFWLSGWLKESKKDGKKFFSLSVRPKNDSKPVNKPVKSVELDDFDQSIPF
jgi:uncharacterized protein (DUF736 family)